MTTRFSLLVLVLGLGLQPGCRHKAPPPPRADETAALPGPSSRVERERRLALLPPPDNREVDQEIRKLQDSARRNPAKVDYWIALGRTWVRLAREASDPGYFRNADACAEVALDLQPGSALALNLRGLVYLNDHQFEKARALMDQIVKRTPDDAMAWGTLSDALLELGRFPEAADAAQKMIDLKPNLPSYSRASYLRWLTGDTTTAKEYMRLAIDASTPDRRDPEPRAWALTQAALYFFHAGDYEGAEAGFDLALRGFADYPQALVGKARVALARGDGKQAADLLDRAYKQSPLAETAWLLGDARALAGDDKGAEAAYTLLTKTGRRVDPRTLALFYATKGKETAEALRLAEEEHKVRGDIYTLDAYAFALYRAGRLPEARKAIDEALRLGTKDARLLFHSGAIHLATGDAQGGVAQIKKALALNPKFDLTAAAEAARLLEQHP